MTPQDYARRQDEKLLAAVAERFPEVDDAFGHWFAGFFDGEGSLGIYVDRRTGVYRCHATIKLRDDDEPILQEITERLGLGSVGGRSVRAGNTQPQIGWAVASKPECLRLVQLFDRFPLRAKKARDYAIWREGVFALERRRQAHGWTRMALIAERLRAARSYSSERPFETSSQLESLDAPEDQLTMALLELSAQDPR